MTRRVTVSLMNAQTYDDIKAEVIKKDASINLERIRGAIWFCDEMTVKMEGNGHDGDIDVTGTDTNEGKAV